MKIEVPMAKSVLSCNLTVNQGKYSFDPVTRVLQWEVGKIEPSKLPNMRGNVSRSVGNDSRSVGNDSRSVGNDSRSVGNVSRSVGNDSRSVGK